MTRFKLSRREHQKLTHLMAHTAEAAILRRSQALLWLDQGESVAAVAARLGVSRQLIYYWIDLFHRDTPADLASRLAVGARSGRPPTFKGIIDPLIDEAIDHDPRLFGYNSTVWTAPLIAYHLQSEHGHETSVSSVRLALARLELTWKRPRHRLALRSPTWRQAKGGLKRGWQSERVPSS